MREINGFDEYCRYCGNLLKSKKEEAGFFTNTKRYCDCEDVLKIEEINKKIRELEESKPKEKYLVFQKIFIQAIK